MERKLDSDIEEIRNVLLSGASQTTWNKQNVWARIEQKETKKRVWPFALAACVALVSFFVFWKLMPTETSQVATVTLPEVKSETGSMEVMSTANEPEKKEVLAKVPQLKSKAESLLMVQNKEAEVVVLPSKVEPLAPIEIAAIKTEIDFKDVEIKAVEIPEEKYSEKMALIESKEAFGGKKITLIIPEDDKAAVRSNVKVVRFIQKVGEYNRTGDWEPEKKNKIGELWAKFKESTKTNDKSEF